jgi:Txe/YoeB family toxin of Txe-Axe toxin-antitoxin module
LASLEDNFQFQEHNRQLLRRDNNLVEAILLTAYEGIGKPESLLAGRSWFEAGCNNDEQRLDYSVFATEFNNIACRYRYGR